MDNASEDSSTTSGKSRHPDTEIHNLKSYREYLDFFDDLEQHSKPIYIFYTGSESPVSGYSWCPLCTQVLHTLEKKIFELNNVVFLTVKVGSQEDWEDQTNPFRTDDTIKLKVIPTFCRYNTSKKLEGRHCLKSELLDLIFEEECEFQD